MPASPLAVALAVIAIAIPVITIAYTAITCRKNGASR
jgi:hypothetical protein